MKKINWMLLSAIVLMSTALTLVSCGGNDGDEQIEIPNGGVEKPTPEKPSEPVAMDPMQQKQYIETVGIEFVNNIKAGDFQNVVDLVNYIDSAYDGYDDEDVEEWLAGCLEDITEVLGSYDEKDGEWTYNYTEYSRLYAASNFKGCFTAANGKWVYTSSNDLSFIVMDSKGEECVIKLKASDKGKKVYAGSSEDWDYDYNGYEYITYIDNYDNYITIPETITVTLSQGGKELAALELKTDLNSVAGENFNIEKDSYNVSASFNLNGYEWNLSKLAYKAQGNSSVKLDLSKNDDVLLSMSASVDMTIDGDELTSAKNAQLSFDVLGKIKVAGSCSDIAKLSEKFEKADDNDENEGTYKSYISEANNLLKLKVYYDGTNQEQASVRLEPFYDDYYGEWYSVLVICFEDGTSYSTFEAFFDETDFRNLINALEKLVSDFDAL